MHAVVFNRKENSMKSIIRKLTAAALAALMILPLSACAVTGDTDGSATDTSANPADTSSTDAATEGVTENQNYICELPEKLDYKKEEINVLCIKAPGRDDELISEKLGEGIISDAVYERNTAVESRLNVKFVYTEESDDTAGQSTVTTTVEAGDRSLDIFTLGTNWSIAPAISGCYLNLKGVENINLSKHYWSQDYNNMVTFTADEKQFLATSPAALSLFRLTYLTIFNRDLFENYKIPDLYDVVKNGEWTLEYQKSIVADIWNDLDGDNKAGEGDFYGFVTGTCISLDAYAVSSDISLVVRDPDTGYLVFNGEDFDRMIEMSEKVSALYTDKGTFFFPDMTQDLIGENYIIDKFGEKEALMATTQFLALEKNISTLSALNYGIVPMPKLDTMQADYMTYVQDQVTSYGISSAQNDEDRITMLGAALEAIAYHSYLTVRPAYYDSTLSLRFMQDPESRSILDTMFETISFDYCYAIGVGGVRDELRTRLSTAAPGVAGRYKAWERSVNRQLDKDNAALDKLD